MPPSRSKFTTRLDPRSPLVFDTRALPRRPGESRTQIRDVPAPADLRTGMAGVPEGAPMRLDVTLESVTEGVLVTATLTAPVTGECARCLEPLAQTIEVHCRELFSYSLQDLDGAEDGYALDGDLLDFEPVLRDALVPALPLAPLCRADCPGLCADCGAQLAHAGPGHGHDRPVDHRWAGLADLTQARQDSRTREESGRGRP